MTDEVRLERLESQCAFQEHLLGSLDATIAQQSLRLAALEREIASLRAGLTVLRESGNDASGNEPPPHY